MFEMCFVGQIHKFRSGGSEGGLEGLDQKSSLGYSEKCSPQVLDVCAN